jgi:16S rRNA processing protein RimM
MKIGNVTDVEDGYQTILRISTDEKEFLVPYVPAFIKNVDIAHKRIDINVIEGML